MKAIFVLSLAILAAWGAWAIAGSGPSPSSPAAAKQGSTLPFSLDPAREEFTGIVAERLQAGPYAYIHVTPHRAPPRWAVTLGNGPEPGQHVVVTVYGTQKDFASKRLGRTFAALSFARFKPEPALTGAQQQQGTP